MPAIVGPIKIVSVGGGVVNFGDSFYIAPKETAKTLAGSGAFNTGDFLATNNWLNSTNGVDPDVNDQNVSGNA
ncbi:spore germination protein [Bacillus sp. HMF5848]|uniref:spore germination protein n=1 Tax=Bacillus sp. HMF5848 TaxID=2495421 RepID=UPI000F785609|nr:spore germination protein [Bacillus sp. HMF5848]RSK26360.1 spore germination protein [Bacillus sp. HMF5848]